MENTVNMTGIYGTIALAAFVLMIGYGRLIKEKEKWLQYLYIAVFGIDMGYFFLSISGAGQIALLVNGMIDLFSAFLPFFMLMAIMKVCTLKCAKSIFTALIVAGCLIFMLSVGGDCLPFLNFLHAVYLFLYFVGMLGVILYTMKKRKSISCKLAAFLLMAVLCNMLTWLLEQLVHMELEILAFSYIFTEVLMLLMYMIVEETRTTVVQKPVVDLEEENLKEENLKAEKLKEEAEADEFASGKCGEISLEDNVEAEAEISAEAEIAAAGNEIIMEQIRIRTEGTELTGIEKLSVREMEVLLLIMDNKKRKDIAQELEITENTVKKHTSHIFSKLGISNRKELFAKCCHVLEEDQD